MYVWPRGDGEPSADCLDFVLGTAQLTSPYGVLSAIAGERGQEHVDEVLSRAAELGMTALDTAPVYGQAEAAIGRSGTSMAVHTKLDPSLAPTASVRRSLERLRRDSVELLYIHQSSEILKPESPVVDEAASLVGTLVGTLGVSVYSAEEFDAAVSHQHIGAIQAPINLLDRHIDVEQLESASSRGVRVYARSVLLQGVLPTPPAELDGAVGRLRPYVADVHQVSLQLGRTVIEVALGWVRSLPGLHGVVVGAESIADIDSLWLAFRSPALTASERAVFDELALPPHQFCDPRTWADPHG